MSKAIGKALGRYASQNEYGNETMINNYLISQGLPPLANYQANQNMQTNNNFTPVTNMLAQGLQQAHPQEIAEHELDMQIKNLQAQLPNNPALQQQYSAALTNVLATQINGQAGITTSTQKEPFDLMNQNVILQNPLQQVDGSIGDMIRNYVNMKLDNTIGADDYFHCKANYEAAQRGPIGENVAKRLGNAKEEFDFWDNQFRKGLSPIDACFDKIHDRTINQIGRQKAKSGLYTNSKDACYPYRVNGINEKY